MAMYFRTKLREKSEPMKEKIKESYLTLAKSQGKRPASMLALADALAVAERELYAHYASVGAIERELLLDSFTQTTDRLAAEAVYADYSTREKLLAIAYTWLEVLKEERSLWLIIMEGGQRTQPLDGAEKAFEQFAKNILNEGISRQEIAERLWISDYNANLLWLQYAQVIVFWLRDESDNFEKTDTFVEKSLNFLLDLLQPNFFDSGFSWLKFRIQG